MVDCERRGKFFGCNFQPRYNKEPTEFFEDYFDEELMEPIKKNCVKVTYVCDVCSRCGRTTADPK